MWFDDRWADMLLAAMACIAKGSSPVILPASSEDSFTLSILPKRFISPVTFIWEKDKESSKPQEEDPLEEVIDLDEEDEDEDGNE